MSKSTDEVMLEIINKHGEGGLCEYCIYGIDCPGKVVDIPDGFLFPACVGLDIKDWLDIAKYQDGEGD